MTRPPTGAVVKRKRKQGTVYGLRFQAHGQRHYLTLNAATRAEAEEELANILADVRRGIWRPPATDIAPPAEQPDPTFHEFASEWLDTRKHELSETTVSDSTWALSNHLLPFFASHRLPEITIRAVDRYKTAKLAEGTLSANSINKTLSRLAQALEFAVEYELLAANPAAGKRRRVRGTTPRRPWVEPEQLMTLLAAAEQPKAVAAGSRPAPAGNTRRRRAPHRRGALPGTATREPCQGHRLDRAGQDRRWRAHRRDHPGPARRTRGPPGPVTVQATDRPRLPDEQRSQRQRQQCPAPFVRDGNRASQQTPGQAWHRTARQRSPARSPTNVCVATHGVR